MVPEYSFACKLTRKAGHLEISQNVHDRQVALHVYYITHINADHILHHSSELAALNERQKVGLKMLCLPLGTIAYQICRTSLCTF